MMCIFFFFFQAEDGIRDHCVTGVQTCALPIYPDHADYHAFLPFDGVHLVSEVLHLFSNLVNLFPCCMQFHGDDHFPGPLDLFFAPKTKSPLGWRVGRKLFSVDSLTETPHAAWMDSK